MKVPLSFVSNQTPSTASLRADYAGGPFHQSNFLCSSQTLSKTVVTCVTLSSKIYAVLSSVLKIHHRIEPETHRPNHLRAKGENQLSSKEPGHSFFKDLYGNETALYVSVYVH